VGNRAGGLQSNVYDRKRSRFITAARLREHHGRAASCRRDQPLLVYLTVYVSCVDPAPGIIRGIFAGCTCCVSYGKIHDKQSE
jgi:hypothetical protein